MCSSDLYDIIFRMHASHTSLGEFKDALHTLNISLLARFAAEGIEIPFPTQIEIIPEAGQALRGHAGERATATRSLPTPHSGV